MGQGYSMTTLSAASMSIDVPELADFVHEKTLASARFMKSVRARSQNGFVFVKAVMKPYSGFDVQSHVKQITHERNVLKNIPNALGYQRIVEVANGGFLVRQHVYNSVYDRLSTRPFLEDVEKKWLVFQLLCAVRDCHAKNIYHGDIKTENLLVTSWNWLYLTDFSAVFKPTHLPEDNPADFSFHFDTSGRRVCYVAPERFTSTGLDNTQDELNWAMDMFSVGCAIAEIFLEGPIFNLSQIFKYKNGDYSPEHTHINKIADLEIRDMILNMIDLDPEKRYSAEQHLSFYKSKVFPEYFYSFLHQYMQDLTASGSLRRAFPLDTSVLSESDDKIDRVYHDFDKVSYFLGYGVEGGKRPRLQRHRTSTNRNSQHRTSFSSVQETNLNDGTLLFLDLVSAAVRNTAKASARLKACDLLVSFAERLPDEAKLDRILPYIVGLLTDRSDTAKISALYAMTSILEGIRVVSPINAYLFPEYIFPKLRLFLTSSNHEPSALVRAAYASCLSSLALSSSRMLDMVQAIRADGRLSALAETDWAPDSSFHGLYDVARAELLPHFEEATTALITDPDPSVRRALLGSVAGLCIFFGSAKSSDLIVSHLNTYLNDKDWILRCAFYDALVGVGLYVGTSSLEQFMLPVMIGSLTDKEAFVVEKVLRSLSRMAALGLFQKATTWQLTGIASRFLVHPSIWIRESAAQFVVQSSRFLSSADKHCIVMPIVQPFLKGPVHELSEERLLDNLKSPLQRNVLEAATTWASKKEKSLFWTAAARDRVFVLSDPDSQSSPSTLSKRLPHRISPSQRDKDDQVSLETLRSLGMTINDEVKLLALREYILRTAQQRNEDAPAEKQSILSDIIPLTQVDATPQNVFFDSKEPLRDVGRQPHTRDQSPAKVGTHSLTDALLDASTNLDGALRNRAQAGRDIQDLGRDRARSAKLDHLDVVRNSPVAGSPDRRETASSTSTPKRPSSGATRHALLDPETHGPKGRVSGELRHRGSAISLLNRGDAMKANANIATTTENAFGKLDRTVAKQTQSETSMSSLNVTAKQKSRSESPGSRAPSTPTRTANHTYTGTDPHVLKLLENHLAENFPIDMYDFGPAKSITEVITPLRRVTDAANSHAPQSGASSPAFHREKWQPTGELLTQFSEHTGAINRVVASPDHSFFVTASDDGSCKVWDTSRLEKNVTSRSRQTHRHAPGSRVKSLCFVEDTFTFVSGATDGSLHAVKIDHKNADRGEAIRYGKPILMRDYQIPRDSSHGRKQPDGTIESQYTEEFATWLYHYRTPTSQSILLAATNRCRVIIIDMKNMEILHSMENPLHHGTLTTFCVDRRHQWLLLGTNLGILDLWDLRFKLRLRAFGLGGSGFGKKIDRLILHPTKGHGKWVIVSCGGEQSVWDIEKMTCREVLRASTFDPGSPVTNHAYEAWFPDEDSGAKLLAETVRRFQTEVGTDEAQSQKVPSDASPPPQNGRSGTSVEDTRGNHVTSGLRVPALFAHVDYLANAAQPDNPNKSPILFSAGSDRSIRYWDLAHYENSFVVSGPLVSDDKGGDDSRSKVRYESSWPPSMSLSGSIQLVEEKVLDQLTNANRDGTTSASTTPRKRREREATTGVKRTQKGNTTGGSSGTGTKVARSTLVSNAQQQLLKTHMDAISDLCVLRRPYGCVVSVDRGGCIFIFH